MTGADSTAIAVRGLVKRYGGHAVVDHIDFDVRTGEVFALLGPNGAGKTTTVEIIEGYRRRDAGLVSVLGVDPATGGANLRARVGLMLQGGGVDPRARPSEILRLFASFHADSRDPRQLIRLVGLDAVASTTYRHLSGGERQRLGLAVALVGRPELLILDEPTAGMDPAARAATRGLIRSLRDEGIATLLTTHDLGDVERVADQVAIIDGGRIVAAGTPAELAGGAAPRLTLWFGEQLSTEEVASLGSQLEQVELAFDAGDPRRLIVHGQPPDPELVARVAAWAASRQRLIERLETSGGSLERRYLEITGDAAVATDENAEAT